MYLGVNEMNNRWTGFPKGRSEELNRCFLSNYLLGAYRFKSLRRLCILLADRFEGGPFYTYTIREILKKYHQVSVGAYSYGECMRPGAFPKGVVIERYCSIAAGVRILLRDHPLSCLSMHPFFFNSKLGFVERDAIPSGNLNICHDAWIGRQAIIVSGCSRIGIGAVVGAGAVVSKDVPDFAVALGNPATVIKYRFEKEICQLILESRWWEKSVDECVSLLTAMNQPINENPFTHPFLRNVKRNTAEK